MEITVRGQEGGASREHVYRLLDRTDARTGTSSMARTTGYTCTAAARLVLEGRFTRVGICPPEYMGADEDCFEHVLADLAERGVRVERSAR
jgi:saccharopine dehydrogenase-like NADP-dependent oxidoreductase